MSDARSRRFGADVEQAMRDFEAALTETDGGRHADPDEESPHLAELRMQVIRRAEALPSMCWPRAKCAHCRGAREVTAVAMHSAAGGTPTLASRKRLCPQCRGTGLTLTPGLELEQDQPDSPVS